MWGYALRQAGFQHPGPVLCVNEGDVVTVILRQQPDGGVLDHLPRPDGRDGQRRPRSPQFNGSGKLVSLVQTAAATAAA